MVDRTAVVASLKKIKTKFRKIINIHADEAARMAVETADPNVPIIVVAQMAIAQALVEYLKDQGVPLPEAVNITTQTTGHAMQTWLKQLARGTETGG